MNSRLAVKTIAVIKSYEKESYGANMFRQDCSDMILSNFDDCRQPRSKLFRAA